MFHAPAKSVLVSVHRLPSEASTNGHSGNSVCNTLSQHQGHSGQSLQVERLLQTQEITELSQLSRVTPLFQNLNECFYVSCHSGTFSKKHFNIILSVSVIPVSRLSTAAVAHP
jgi:hypothetical protein